MIEGDDGEMFCYFILSAEYRVRLYWCCFGDFGAGGERGD